VSAPFPVGLIGAGKHGQRYLHHILADVPELRVVALCRHDVERGEAQARELGGRFHAHWRELVADPAVAGVVAVVPPSLHRSIAEAVATSRKALLIEKPLATTSQDAAAIVRSLRDAGVPCLMAHTLRWNTVAAALRERLPGLGPLRALVVNQRFEPSPLGWLDRPELSGGGILLHTGVHSFDLVRWLTGHEVTRVWCRTARAITVRTEDNFLATLELDGSDALVAVAGSRSTAGRSGLVDAACRDAQIVGDHQQHWLHLVRGLERLPVDLGPASPTVREVARAFARLVLHGEWPAVRLEDGARAVAIAEACMRSAAAGTPMPVASLSI
jgi:myo-inositol 2-dehydrogenase / D-chiro-inositol 1-dehydrogenase